MPLLPHFPRHAKLVDAPGKATTHFADWMLFLWTEVNRLIQGVFEGGVFERGRTVAMGEWIAVPFDAANFHANGSMTWTVAAPNVITNRYTRIGNTLIWTLHVLGTSVSGTPSTELRVTLPAGLKVTGAAQVLVPCGRVRDNGVITPAFVGALLLDTFVRVQLQTLGNWSASAAATDVYFQIALEVE